MGEAPSERGEGGSNKWLLTVGIAFVAICAGAMLPRLMGDRDRAVLNAEPPLVEFGPIEGPGWISGTGIIDPTVTEDPDFGPVILIDRMHAHSPAEKNGLWKGDRIVLLYDAPLRQGDPRLLAGPLGSIIRMEIARPHPEGGYERLTFRFAREKVPTEAPPTSGL
jgi:hypothetical protein